MEELKLVKCPICKKKYHIWNSSLYCWKINNIYYCSYTCMRVKEKEDLEKKNKKFKKY